MGVDAIALVSIIGALLLDQSLAAIVVAIMYAGGTALEISPSRARSGI